MAIYTKISKNDVVSIEKKFNLGKIIYFKGIKKGIENTNYLLKTKNKKFILTLFEKRVQKKDLPFFMKLMDKLNIQKINCPKPQINKKGNFVINIKNIKQLFFIILITFSQPYCISLFFLQSEILCRWI